MALKIAAPLDLSNQRISNLGSPSLATDAVTKSYVDNAIVGLDWKASVQAASAGNVDLAAPGATLDGVTLAAGDRILLKDQTAGAENGIYEWGGAAAALTRAPDADTDAEVTPGMAVPVEGGTTNADRTFLLTTDGPIILGTTALAFSPFSSGNAYTAGDGLTLSGSSFAVNAGTGLTFAAGTRALTVDTAVMARKYAANIGDGASSTITVAHNLGTRDVQVQVFTNAAPYDTVLVEVQRTDANNVLVNFGTAPAAGAYRVAVIG